MTANGASGTGSGLADCPIARLPSASITPGLHYEAWAPRWTWIGEAAPLSEAALALIWEGQRYPPGALATAAGGRVEVLHPGRRGGGAGPDFREAALVIDGERRLGDVELHLRASAFASHGHATDPAYDNVVLHVVFEDNAGGRTRLASGASVPVAAFAPWVRRRAADIAAWSAQPPLFEEPCRGAGTRLHTAGILKALAAAGRRRLLERSDSLALEAARLGADEAVWAALLVCLGYGGDRDGFRRLAGLASLGPLRGRSESETEAALLYLAGLGPPPAFALPPPIVPPVREARGRPANAPGRRLAAAATLLARADGGLAKAVRDSVVTAGSGRELVDAWVVPARQGRLALLGRERAQELVINVVLPFAATQPSLRAHALDLAEVLPPLRPYGRTVALERNLAGVDGRRAVRSALAQQGLLVYQAEWCSQGGCGRCPLS
jgi:hypothetical protein